MSDGRTVLYRALSRIEDCLIDGYDSDREVPGMEEIDAQAAGNEDSPVDSAAKVLPTAAYTAATRVPKANDSLEAVASETARCNKCRLTQSRKRAIPGQGVQRPVVLVLGEAPGPDDDEKGYPFSGAQGELLDRMLSAIGLSRTTNCYLTTLVKCKPPERDASPDEQSACIAYLNRQLDLLKPQAILALGRTAAQHLLSTKEGMTKLRGKIWDSGGIPCIPTFSPANIIKDENLKRSAWEDLKLLKSVLRDA